MLSQPARRQTVRWSHGCYLIFVFTTCITLFFSPNPPTYRSWIHLKKSLQAAESGDNSVFYFDFLPESMTQDEACDQEVAGSIPKPALRDCGCSRLFTGVSVR